MWTSIAQGVHFELGQLKRDRWLQAFTLWLLPLLALLFIAIFWSKLPESLPIYVVDQDKGSLARSLVRKLDANPELSVSDTSGTLADAKASLVSGSHYAIVVIPRNFQKNVVLGHSPSVTVFINAQYLLVAKALRSAILTTELTLAGEVDAARALVDTTVISAAVKAAQPIRMEVSALYNSDLNYAQFLIPGILFALLQVLISSTTIIVVSREFKWGGQEYWSQLGLISGLIAKQLPYCGIFTLQSLGLLSVYFGVLGWPHHASLSILVLLIVLFVLACQTLGLFFYAIALNPERALGFAGAFSAPAFAFLGLTFPESDMSVFAQFWRDLMPAAHIIDAYILRSAYGAANSAVIFPGIALAITFLLLPWSSQRVRHQIESPRATVSHTSNI